MAAARTRIPELSGRDLSGRAVRLPTDLPGRPTVAVLGFTQDHQRDIDRWGAALPEVQVLEIVLIPADQERRRWIIEGGMALSLRDPAVRARTWCVYGDLDDFVGRLGVSSRGQVLAIVAMPDGDLHRLVVGPPTPSSVHAMREALSTASTSDSGQQPVSPSPGTTAP